MNIGSNYRRYNQPLLCAGGRRCPNHRVIKTAMMSRGFCTCNKILKCTVHWRGFIKSRRLNACTIYYHSQSVEEKWPPSLSFFFFFFFHVVLVYHQKWISERLLCRWSAFKALAVINGRPRQEIVKVALDASELFHHKNPREQIRNDPTYIICSYCIFTFNLPLFFFLQGHWHLCACKSNK